MIAAAAVSTVLLIGVAAQAATTPDVPSSSAPAPRGQAPAAPTVPTALKEGRDYSFIAKDGGRPIKWACTKTIPVVLDGIAPAGTDKTLTSVVKALADASGLPLVVTPSAPTAGAIHVQYVAEGQPALGMELHGSVMGKGGPQSIDGKITSGSVIVRSDAPGAEPSTLVGAYVLMHELAHAAGLSHASETANELMAPTSRPDSRPVLGPGDRYALSVVGCPH